MSGLSIDLSVITVENKPDSPGSERAARIGVDDDPGAYAWIQESKHNFMIQFHLPPTEE